MTIHSLKKSHNSYNCCTFSGSLYEMKFLIWNVSDAVQQRCSGTFQRFVEVIWKCPSIIQSDSSQSSVVGLKVEWLFHYTQHCLLPCQTFLAQLYFLKSLKVNFKKQGIAEFIVSEWAVFALTNIPTPWLTLFLSQPISPSLTPFISLILREMFEICSYSAHFLCFYCYKALDSFGNKIWIRCAWARKMFMWSVWYMASHREPNSFTTESWAL